MVPFKKTITEEELMPKLVKLILKILGGVVGLLIILILLLIGFIEMRWDSADSRPAPNLTAPRDSASLARGEYIFKYQAQCWGCHQSASDTGLASSSGGREFDLSTAGPGFGKWYSRNLTPDMETGLGGWTDGEIVQALREGIRKDRTPLFPIMPIDWYHDMADEDVLAVVAYLRTLPPLRNTVPEREPSFVAKALFTFGMIGPMTPVTSPIVAPPRGITPEYGKYISSYVADCADCHTPRNLENGQFYMDSLFAGSSFAFGFEDGSPLVSYARNITPDVETGIGAWTEEQFLAAVTGGMRPDGTALTTHMPYAYYKFLEVDELRAMYAYLKTIPAMRRTVPANEYSTLAKSSSGAERGGFLFQVRCQACHGLNGAGAPPTNVKLAEVASSLADSNLTEFIKAGMPDLKMPSFGKTLRDDELNDIVAFIRTWEKK